MYLKSLVIKGFKSFAERSSLDFEPGISVIVGPNGSGKSNISEAVLWVLGERNPRNLRVQSLEELIFSGSSARQAVSVAEVDLVLDNSDGTLPIEFQQVEIKRRMYRSGESEYFINKSPCRRMDIIDILYDTGLGSGVNSIIGQGNLTAVLESRPEDRRSLIEDAAGVLKHKKRKEKASRKLDRMDVTLERVNDIIKVVESQLRPLERQAKRAQKAAELEDELKALDLSLAVDELRNLQTQWNQIVASEREVDAERDLAQVELDEKEAELEKRQRTLEEKGLFAGDINEQRVRCIGLMQRLDSGMLLLEEKGKNMVSRLSDLRATIHSSKTRLDAAKDERDEIVNEAAEAADRLTTLYATFNELTRSSEAATRARKEAEETYTKLSSALRGRESALASAKADLAKASDSLSSLDVEEDLIKSTAEHTDSEFSEIQSNLSARRSKLEEAERQLVSMQRKSELAKSDIDKFVRILDERKSKLDAEREKLADARAELKGLEEINRAFESASPARAWVGDNPEIFPGVVGSVASAVVFDDSKLLPYDMDRQSVEHIIENLIGSDLFGLMIRDIKSAEQITQKVIDDTDHAGALSLIPVDGARYMTAESANVSDGVRLMDYLNVGAEQHAVLSALIGDVYLVATPKDALSAHLRDKVGVRFVSANGAVVWPNGKVTLGEQSDDVDGILERRRRAGTLATDIESMAARVSDAELAVSEAEGNLETAQQDDLDLSSGMARYQGDVDAGRQEVGRLEQSATQVLARQDDNKRKLADVEKRRGMTSPLKNEFAQRIESVSAEIETFTEQVNEASEALAAATREREEITTRLTECKVQLEVSKGSANRQATRESALKKEIEDLEHTLEVSSETESSLNVIRMRIDPLYKVYSELHDGVSVWATKLRDQAQLEQTDSTNLRKIINEANKAVQDAREHASQLADKHTEVLVEKSRLEESVKHATERITTEYNTALETALEAPSPEDRHIAEEQADRLRSKLANLGAVNHVAMEEYETLKNRRDYMLSQIDDLTEARKALSKISVALDRKIRNRFNETFAQVNKNFQDIFGILFPGGTGELTLTEGETPDDAGVEVSAQPRGKKISKLSMMSGGEKSLVAMALLFAIYQIRHVPFYILDEVEAALDDTNLRRLLEYINFMRDKTQIIMVSHQRRTMEQADVLYGVTMQAAGISKIVSQRLEDALKHATPDVASTDV